MASLGSPARKIAEPAGTVIACMCGSSTTNISSCPASMTLAARLADRKISAASADKLDPLRRLEGVSRGDLAYTPSLMSNPPGPRPAGEPGTAADRSPDRRADPPDARVVGGVRPPRDVALAVRW